jgi:MFS transporter, ACS family, solute carrier family 17 (sodium-dependent inorganic phosphate cotransporter), other
MWCSWRAVVVYLNFACNACLYLCRTSITVAIVYMFDDPSVQGTLLSAFYIGYAISQIPGGWLAQKHGAKPVLSCAVFLWSTVTILTCFCAGNVPALFFLRLVVGLAEGVNYPCQMALNAAWSPRCERNRAWTLGAGGESAGTILALFFGPMLIEGKCTLASLNHAHSS